MYQLNLEQFAGPIEKLLELIEEKKLDITEISLAEVTADFLNYLNKLNEENIENKTIEISPRLLADFVVVASRLLLIKSKALLPGLQLTNEEERDIKDLETRLRFYQQFKPAVNHLNKLWEQKSFSVSRPLFSNRPTIFYPSKNITSENFQMAANSIFEIFRRLSPEVKTINNSIISLEEKIAEIIGRVENGFQKFEDLTKERPRTEIIVMFLALLHLLSRQLVTAEQNGKFSDIMIEKI